MIKFGISNDLAVRMTKRIVRIHAPKIVSILGINPSILDKIVVSDRVNADCAGRIHRDTLDIELFPVACLYDEDGKLSLPSKVILFLPLLYLHQIFNLAHELRHAHQIETKNPRFLSIDYAGSPMLYRSSWKERDANAFARRYIKSLFSFTRIKSN